MATTATLLSSKGANQRVYNVSIASADTTGAVDHELPFTPDFAMITPTSVGCYSQTLVLTSITATQVNFTKGGAAVASFLLVVGRSYAPGARFT